MSNQERIWLFSVQVDNQKAIASIEATILKVRELQSAFDQLNGRAPAVRMSIAGTTPTTGPTGYVTDFGEGSMSAQPIVTAQQAIMQQALARGVTGSIRGGAFIPPEAEYQAALRNYQEELAGRAGAGDIIGYGADGRPIFGSSGAARFKTAAQYAQERRNAMAAQAWTMQPLSGRQVGMPLGPQGEITNIQEGQTILAGLNPNVNQPGLIKGLTPTGVFDYQEGGIFRPIGGGGYGGPVGAIGGPAYQAAQLFQTEEGIKRVTKAEQEYDKALAATEKQGGSTYGSLENYITRYLKWMVAAAITVGVLQTIQRLFQEQFTLLVDMEKQAAQVGFVLGMNADKSTAFVQNIQGIGAQYGLGPRQGSEAAVRIAQSSRDATEQQRLATSAAQLAMVSGQSYGQSVDDLVRIQKAFNLSVGDSTRIMDTLATMFRIVPGTVKENIEMLERLGPIAETTGLKMEQVAVLAAQSAQQSGAAITAVTNAITRAYSNLEQVATQRKLESFGIESLTKAGDLRPFLDILTEVYNKRQQLLAQGDETQAFELAAAVGGRRPEQYRLFISFLDQITKQAPVTASAQQQVNAVLETTATKVERLTSAWGLMLEKMGNTAMIKQAVDAVQKLVDNVTALTEKTNKYGVTQIAEQLGAGVRSGQISFGDAQGVMLWMDMLNPGSTYTNGASFWSGFSRGAAQPRAKPLPGQTGGDGAYVAEPPYPAGFEQGYRMPPTVTGDDKQTADQALVRFGILNATRLQEINKRAITEEQLLALEQQSSDRAKLEVQLWREKLTALGIVGAEQEDYIKKLQDQIAGAAIELNVNGRPRLVTGAGAAYAGEMLPQVAPDTSFMRANMDLGQAARLAELYQKYHQLLESAGFQEDPQNTVMGFGKDSVTSILRAGLVYQQAMSLALAEIERTQKDQVRGVFNFPGWATPWVTVANQAFTMDRVTREGALGTLPGQGGVFTAADKDFLLKLFGSHMPGGVGAGGAAGATTKQDAFQDYVYNQFKLDAQDRRDLYKEVRLALGNTKWQEYVSSELKVDAQDRRELYNALKEGGRPVTVQNQILFTVGDEQLKTYVQDIVVNELIGRGGGGGGGGGGGVR